MRLPPRLEAVLQLLGTVDRLIDVGTDHALLPIAAIRRGLAVSAVGIEKAAGPLRRARDEVRAAGMEAVIEIRQTDGLAGITLSQGDGIAIAGLSAKTIVDVLQSEKDRLRNVRALVCQPDFNVERLHAWCGENGFQTIAESVVHGTRRWVTLSLVCP